MELIHNRTVGGIICIIIMTIVAGSLVYFWWSLRASGTASMVPYAMTIGAVIILWASLFLFNHSGGITFYDIIYTLALILLSRVSAGKWWRFQRKQARLSQEPLSLPQTRVFLIGITTLLFIVISSLPNRPGPSLLPLNDGCTIITHRGQHGLPLIMLKSAINSDCALNSGSQRSDYMGKARGALVLNPNTAHEVVDGPYFILANLGIDLLFWSTLSSLIVLTYGKKYVARNVPFV